MQPASISPMISRFAPLLVVTALALILSGAFLSLVFSYEIYKVLEQPEQVKFLSYILGLLPSVHEQPYVISGTSNGQPFEMSIPSAIVDNGKIIIAFVIFSLIAQVVVRFISTGTMIFKVLKITSQDTSNQEDIDYARTRNSNNPR